MRNRTYRDHWAGVDSGPIHKRNPGPDPAKVRWVVDLRGRYLRKAILSALLAFDQSTVTDIQAHVRGYLTSSLGSVFTTIPSRAHTQAELDVLVVKGVVTKQGKKYSL